MANEIQFGVVARADSAPSGNRGDFAVHPLVFGGKSSALVRYTRLHADSSRFIPVQSNLTPTPQTLITGYGMPNRALLDHFLLTQCGITRDTMDQIGEILAREDAAKAREFERWQSMMTGVSDKPGSQGIREDDRPTLPSGRLSTAFGSVPPQPPA